MDKYTVGPEKKGFLLYAVADQSTPISWQLYVHVHITGTHSNWSESELIFMLLEIVNTWMLEGKDIHDIGINAHFYQNIFLVNVSYIYIYGVF